MERLERMAGQVMAAVVAVTVCLAVFTVPSAASSGNGIVLYVETVPENPVLAEKIGRHLREKAEARHRGRGLVRVVDRWDSNALVLRVEKLSSEMSEIDRRSTLFTLHDNKIDRDKRDTFPRGSKVAFDMVVSKLTVSYVYRLQMMVGGEVWDAATLEMPAQTLDYRYGEHLRVTGAEGQVIKPADGVYPNSDVEQFLRHGDRNYIDQMYADGLGKATAHLVSKYFGPLNAALRDAPFDDPGTRDGNLLAERFRKIAVLLGRAAPYTEVCGSSAVFNEGRAGILKMVRDFSDGELPFEMGVTKAFVAEIERTIHDYENSDHSGSVRRTGCTKDIDGQGAGVLGELTSNTQALDRSFQLFGKLD